MMKRQLSLLIVVLFSLQSISAQEKLYGFGQTGWEKTKKGIRWIKDDPKKAAALGFGVSALIGAGAYGAYRYDRPPTVEEQAAWDQAVNRFNKDQHTFHAMSYTPIAKVSGFGWPEDPLTEDAYNRMTILFDVLQVNELKRIPDLITRDKVRYGPVDIEKFFKRDKDAGRVGGGSLQQWSNLYKNAAQTAESWITWMNSAENGIAHLATNPDWKKLKAFYTSIVEGHRRARQDVLLSVL